MTCRCLVGGCADERDFVARQVGRDVVEWTGLAYSVAQDFRFPGADRDDVRQEALIAVWGALSSALSSYDGSGTLRGHLALSVRRRLSSKLRESLRLKHGPLNEALTEPESGWTTGTAAEEVPQDARTGVAGADHPSGSVSALLAPLTLVERRACVGVACGMEYAELGDPKSIDNALTRARRKLRAAA